MKKLVAVLCLLLCSSAAQAAPELDADMKAWIAQREVVFATCGAQPIMHHRSESSAHFVHDDGYAVTGWTGGCVNGKRDGYGTLTIVDSMKQIHIDSAPGAELDFSYTGTSVMDATLVRGKMLGLVCQRSYSRVDSTGEKLSTGLGCKVTNGTASTEDFSKAADGSWQQLDTSGKPLSPPVTAPAGSLEALSDQIIAAARAGKPIPPVLLPTQSIALADLVKGGVITVMVNKDPLGLSTKRVAIILSTGTLNALERYNKMQKSMTEKLEDEDDAAERAKFATASDSAQLMMAIANGLRVYAHEIVPADDLGVLADGKADYALVIDWTYDGDYALSRRQFNAKPVCKGDIYTCPSVFVPHLKGWLVDRKFHAVRQFSYTGGVFVPKRTDDTYEFYYSWLSDELNSLWDKNSLNSMYYSAVKRGLEDQ